MVGRTPKLKIIQATHTGELAVRFGRKAKTLIDSEDYSKKYLIQHSVKIVRLQVRWETAQGGEYFAAGVGGAITGRGADLLIIDDPHSEQDAMSLLVRLITPTNGIHRVPDKASATGWKDSFSYDYVGLKKI